MSDKFSASEESVREVLASLRAKRFMLERELSTCLQESSTRGVQASPSTARAGTSRASVERRTKHKYDLANAKLIPSILPSYIPPLSGVIHRDSVPRDLEYTLVTVFLPKGARTVCVDQDKVAALKFSDFNLGDQKVYGMLTPYKYLTETKRKNSNIVPQ
jgi:hypothetical protein